MPMSTLKRAFLPGTWAERVFWLLIVIPFTLLVWQSFDLNKPSDALLRELVTPEVTPGGSLRLHLRTKTNFVSYTEISQTLYDGSNLRFDFGLQENAPVSPPGVVEEHDVEVLVPKSAHPGPARLLTSVCWRRPLNFVHRIWPVCEVLKPITFTIKNSEH